MGAKVEAKAKPMCRCISKVPCRFGRESCLLALDAALRGAVGLSRLVSLSLAHLRFEARLRTRRGETKHKVLFSHNHYLHEQA